MTVMHSSVKPYMGWKVSKDTNVLCCCWKGASVELANFQVHTYIDYQFTFTCIWGILKQQLNMKKSKGCLSN